MDRVYYAGGLDLPKTRSYRSECHLSACGTQAWDTWNTMGLRLLVSGACGRTEDCGSADCFRQTSCCTDSPGCAECFVPRT